MSNEPKPPIDMKDLAHVIRTPLTVIKTQLAISISADEDKPELKALTNTINEQIELVASILSDLQLMSQANAGQIVAGQDSVDLTEISEEVIAQYKSLESYSDIDFEIDIKNVDQHIVATHEHVWMMINRLVYLATLDGATKVKLLLGKDQISVEDDGLGTSIDQREIQSKAPRYSRRSSIGLAVIRIISSLYGYKLAISAGPRGSKIVLTRHAEL